MKLILEYLKRYKFWFVLNVISVFGFALVELGIPTIISYMIDQGVMNEDKGFLMKMGVLTAVISVIGVCGTILLGYCCARISTGIAHDIRQDVFRKVQTFSHSEMNEIGVASLITRTNNDAFQIMMFMNVILRTAVLTPVMIVVSFMLTVRTSLDLSLIIISTISSGSCPGAGRFSRPLRATRWKRNSRATRPNRASAKGTSAASRVPNPPTTGALRRASFRCSRSAFRRMP